jgi:tetratricopeptide (TPR) repeat protein/energy-coupling factor transporter ATP-binding protein EcfA2
MTTETTPTIRILVSSPGDVAVERDKARKVVEGLRKRYAGRLRLETVLWEDLPLGAVDSFQGGIDVVLQGPKAIDIAVFILWSRLGSPLGTAICRPDGMPYRSGTEREFDLMLSARAQSRDDRPEILVYVRQDDCGFKAVLLRAPTDEIEDMLRQHRLAELFIREQFHDAETGSNLRAYHTFRAPNSFAERLKAHLRELLDRIVMDGGFGFGSWEGAPYRGLDVFRAEHAPIFFGRDDEICEALERLRAQAEAGCAFLLLVGASGSGKSSLARAGVLPALETDNLDESVTEWRTAVLAPGECADGLCRGLARTLLKRLPELYVDEESLGDLEQALQGGPGSALSLLLKNSCSGEPESGLIRLVLLVDQLEELFSPSIPESESSSLLSALEALAVSGHVWVLATVRSDFYDRCQQLPELMGMKGDRGQMDLLPPEPSDIHRIITGPALLAGVTFERNASGESLDQRLLNDAVGHPEALPLLEFALAQLYDARTSEGVLTFAAYERFGGVEGAIGRHAESVFAILPGTVRAAFGAVFQMLVAVDEADELRPVRRRVALEALAATPARRDLVQALLAARLLGSDRGEVFVAHEALLRRWDRAVQWIEANRDRLRVRDRIAARMAEGAPLTENDPLTGLARHHLAEHPQTFDPPQRSYIAVQIAQLDAARRRREWTRRAVVAGLAVLALLAVVAATIAGRQRRRADEARQSAEESRDRADAARQQAEELIGFMTFDMYSKLAGVGESGLMDRISQKVESYYRQREQLMEPRGDAMSDGDLHQRLASHTIRGDLLVAQGRSREAEEHFREALRIADALAESDHSNADWKRDLSVAHLKLGGLMRADNRLPEAEQHFREALKTTEALAGSDPNNASWQHDLSVTHVKLGSLMVAGSRLPEAEVHFGEALRIAKALAGSNPNSAGLQRSLSESHQGLGDLKMASNRLPEAKQHYRTALGIAEAQAARDRNNADWQRDVSVGHIKLGDLMRADYRLPEAKQHYRMAVETRRTLAKRDPGNASWQCDLYNSCMRMGAAEMDGEEFAEAKKWFDEASEVVERLAAASTSAEVEHLRAEVAANTVKCLIPREWASTQGQLPALGTQWGVAFGGSESLSTGLNVSPITVPAK